MTTPKAFRDVTLWITVISIVLSVLLTRWIVAKIDALDARVAELVERKN